MNYTLRSNDDLKPPSNLLISRRYRRYLSLMAIIFGLAFFFSCEYNSLTCDILGSFYTLIYLVFLPLSPPIFFLIILITHDNYFKRKFKRIKLHIGLVTLIAFFFYLLNYLRMMSGYLLFPTIHFFDFALSCLLISSVMYEWRFFQSTIKKLIILVSVLLPALMYGIPLTFFPEFFIEIMTPSFGSSIGAWYLGVGYVTIGITNFLTTLIPVDKSLQSPSLSPSADSS